MKNRRPRTLTVEQLYAKAVALLARRSRSAAEIKRLLRPYAADPAHLIEVVSRLKEHSYLDDARFAESFASYQAHVEKYGPRRVARDLKTRGVSEQISQSAVRAAFDAKDEKELMAEFIRKKRMQPPADQREAARLFRRFLAAGFNQPTIASLLREWKVDPEFIDTLLSTEIEASPEE